jgi:uncharacterized protein YbjT (DUF2867 family)
MKTLVIGAHGQIGKILCTKLAAAGRPLRAMVRDEAQRGELSALGAEAVVGDLEGVFEHALQGCDALVFAAGSGGHTGGDKTLLVDLWGALRTFRACEAHGLRRYLMVSALRTHDPDSGRAALRHYLVAKKIADEYLERTSLDYTIVRPGRLTNEPGTGRVKLGAPGQVAAGEIPRADVAEVLAACLDAPQTHRTCFDLVSGPTAIAEAVDTLK